MIRLIERQVYNIQMKSLTMSFLCNFYRKQDNIGIVLQIFDQDKYVTNIAYEEASFLCEDEELESFIENTCKWKTIEKKEDGVIIEQNFKRNSNIQFIWIKDEEKLSEGKQIFYSNSVTIGDEYRKSQCNLKRRLMAEGVSVYYVRIPQIFELRDKAKHPEWELFHLGCTMNWAEARKKEITSYLSKFTDMSWEDAKTSMLGKCAYQSFVRSENGNRTIYLVGPCIVAGWENFNGQRLYEILHEKIEELQLGYNIRNVNTMPFPESNMNEILEYDIKEGDIVILINDLIVEKELVDFDLTEIYNNYTGEKWLYSNCPIHATGIGNELIVHELLDKIILPEYKSLKTDHYKILHKKERQLTYEECDLLKRYLKDTKSYLENIKVNSKMCIGACVMTCNPFTKGHYHLIKYASGQVDFLLVFVVEEDSFSFSFKDRIEMVRLGVRDLNNVAILPSGKFMISKITFDNYFKKEEQQNSIIDASKDTMIFKKYIAPELGISKRFVGEEPVDNVTKQYNRILIKDLTPLLDVIEIPRMKIDGEVISASKLRYYIKIGDFQKIAELAPESTLGYLQKNGIVRM